ncbi:MAG: branched-chain amino acid ABC transporter permease [Promethearchaeota archaeon]
MPKKIRTLLHVYKESIKNFFPTLGRGTKNLVKDLPNQFNNFKNRIFTFKGGLTIFCLIILIIFPFLPDIELYASILKLAMIMTIFAASWDLLAGFVGQVSFGHAIFFGIAGYTGALLIQNEGVPWFYAVFIGALVAVGFGLIIGIPSLRLRGPYLALGTQAFALIVFNLMLTEEVIYGIRTPYRALEYVPQYFILMAFMIISLAIMLIVVKSKMGTIFQSIRDDEICADASGINTTKYKLIGFMISSFFAGLAGSLFMVDIGSVSYANFQPLYSFYAIIMAAIGGLATITGAALGAFIFYILREVFSELFTNVIAIEALKDHGPVLAFSLFLIIVIRFAERGIMRPAMERLKELFDVLMGR